MRSLIRRAFFPGVTGAWVAAARGAAGLVAGRYPARPWQAGGRVVVVAPHPDDETLGVGGTIALHRAAGDEVTVVVVSDGRGSRALGLGAAEMVARRRHEIAAAMDALGVVRWAGLGLREGEWDEARAAVALAPFLQAADVIYAPSCVDFHPEHLRVARLVAGLVQSGQWVRAYELGVPLTPLLANFVADTSAVAEQRARALACFVTQQGALLPLARLARYRAALYGLPHAELFWELPAPAYQRVGEAGAWGWQQSPFRGLRPWPMSDPLAWAVGWRARARLRAIASG